MSNSKHGLRKNASGPASIANNQHHDPSGSQKSANGVPGTIKQVVATSTTTTNLENFAMLWVGNRNAAFQYIFSGKLSDVPATVDATNGMSVPPGESILINCGASDDDMISMAVKSSHADVHITVLEV